MLSGLLFIKLIAHYYADIYDADKRGLLSHWNLHNRAVSTSFHSYTQSSKYNLIISQRKIIIYGW
jgi:hypothetical protein